MTTDLRERLAAELQHLDLLDDLTPDVLRRGRATVRRRRSAVGALAAAAVVAGTVWASAGSGDRGTDAAEQSRESARQEWTTRMERVFAAHLPDGFAAGVTATGGTDRRALEFVASGPDGRVSLNATVYLAEGLPFPACAATTPRCRVLTTPSGPATVLTKVYPEDHHSYASQIWIQGDGVQTIVNVVEVSPGADQFSMDDLTGLASDQELSEAIVFATAHDGELLEYATR
ncbi:hypothetical protein [Nocardioides sp. SR21]|uniref:hypothetical protein n=1 Tax=Nocardioides sp. SR21 TaxID=2919501 RepID=UPI001FAAB717|nr:hypothetical protein [Nocardioides sp. SR21]